MNRTSVARVLLVASLVATILTGLVATRLHIEAVSPIGPREGYIRGVGVAYDSEGGSSPAISASAPQAIQIQLLRLDADNTPLRDEENAHPFATGDRFRLRVAANVPGDIVVLAEDRPGLYYAIYPDASRHNIQQVKVGNFISLPGDDGHFFISPDRRPEERLVVYFLPRGAPGALLSRLMNYPNPGDTPPSPFALRDFIGYDFNLDLQASESDSETHPVVFRTASAGKDQRVFNIERGEAIASATETAPGAQSEAPTAYFIARATMGECWFEITLKKSPMEQ